MNGYFQLEVKEKGVMIHFFPPTEKGHQYTIEDILFYLNYHSITGYNTIEIKRVLEQKINTTLLISENKPPIVGEELFVDVSEDKMSAYAKFYPPFVGGLKMDKRDVIVTLEAQGIKAGINEDAIERFLKNRVYCKKVLLAEGIQPTPGQDATIKYFFDTNLRAKPQLNEDGSVDFHKLNGISHIKKGSILATLIPEKKGRPGRNVLGFNIPPKDVKKKKLGGGKNMSFTEDGLSLVSDVDGHVSLIDGKVFVSNTYEIRTDVDAGTGDIEYNGNIQVKGNVRSGFMLKADGDIIIDGVVEAATVIAEGDIIVARGIQGMGRGLLRAKGNIVTKFIENATVKAGGNVTTEVILHSSVVARDSILVTGKKGLITGGKVSAFAKIEAKTIGSSMGSETVVSVGIDPEEKELEQKYQKDMVQLKKEIERLEPIVKRSMNVFKPGANISPEKVQQMKNFVGQFRAYKLQYEDLETKLNEMYEKQEICKDSQICVYGKVYPGVKIVVSECVYMVKGVSQYCQFRRLDADVKMTGL